MVGTMAVTSLDLGCGQKPGNLLNADIAYGIDVRDDVSSNVVKADLVIEKIPFESNYFDYVTARDFIEHVPRLIYAPQRRYPFVELMNEVWRVLKPGGAFLSITPAFPHSAAFYDPTHVNYIAEETFPIYFCAERLLARMYGFSGTFSLKGQKWEGPYLISKLIKVDPDSTQK
jgi:SAM-dependent methyltransferase